jgi:hypothetical protein
MKRMNYCLLALLVAGLAVCGWLVCRPMRRMPEPAESKAMRSLEDAVRIDRGGPYTGADAEKRRLMEKLREEEHRQRPEEGRN